MKELIKVAEELYKQIGKAQVHLINARLNNDEEGKKSAISEMETAMCNAMQLLKCFIERKDNIVDLGEVWHTLDLKAKHNVDIAYLDIIAIVDNDIIRDINIVPSNNKGIIYLTKNGKMGVLNSIKSNNWDWYVADKYSIIKWTYIDDLLPKGGE